jgi:hypothetical protein
MKTKNTWYRHILARLAYLEYQFGHLALKVLGRA